MTREETIVQLIAANIRGELAPEAQQELESWKAERPENKTFAEQFTATYIKQELTARNKVNTDSGWQLLQNKRTVNPIVKSPVEDVSQVQRPRLRIWRRVAVAASVAVVIATGMYLLFSGTGPVQPIAESTATTPTEPDILPVGNKAILTLSNGKKIALSNAENGPVAQEGGMAISAHKGRLIYENRGEGVGLVYNTVSTMHGGTYQLTLPDKTNVWLNAGSSIRFPANFTGSTRQVEISGELYFEVSKDPHRPFVVAAKDLVVQVLGTHLNVNAYPESGQITTTLLEGSVQISRHSEKVLLKPGQQGVAINWGRVKVIPSADLEEVMGWQQGKFVFKDASLSSIMMAISRHYDVTVEYRDQIPSHFVAIIGHDVPLAKLLHLLELTNLVQFRIEGRKIIVMR